MGTKKETTKKVLKTYGVYDGDGVKIYNTPFEFYDEMNFFETPFPCNANWDKKAWWWIENNKDKCFGNVLFCGTDNDGDQDDCSH